MAIEITKEDLVEDLRKSWGIGSEEKKVTHTTMGVPLRPNDDIEF